MWMYVGEHVDVVVAEEMCSTITAVDVSHGLALRQSDPNIQLQ